MTANLNGDTLHPLEPRSGGCCLAGQQSFDVSTDADLQEVDNALNQARQEVIAFLKSQEYGGALNFGNYRG